VRTTVELIAAKRDGSELTDPEIERLIADYVGDGVPDYQMAALAMAIFYRGLNPRELATWTRAMMNSGRVLDLSRLGPGRIDKHSTGGVGDKISLPLAPAAAACGVIVPMVAGRGLGHSGGTIDKLEAIPGFSASLSAHAFEAVLAAHGCAIIGQTAEIAPADKRLYALRDVTATVESIPLITASIMSKKLAEGIEGLVLDVKVGRGAFMKRLADARALAQALVRVGEEMGKRVVAFLTRMEEPLGRMVGNACEVQESLDVLDGGGPADVVELTVTLGGAMVELAHGVTAEQGQRQVRQVLADGRARARFQAMVAAQGGDLARLPRATGESPVLAPAAGWVGGIDGLEVGLTAVALGAGRTRSDQRIDPVVGIRIDAPRGARVAAGQPLAAVLHGRHGPPAAELMARLERAFTITAAPPEPAPVIIERIGR
jgi:pyrimidine-nucleoside phosphorylase